MVGCIGNVLSDQLPFVRLSRNLWASAVQRLSPGPIDIYYSVLPWWRFFFRYLVNKKWVEHQRQQDSPSRIIRVIVNYQSPDRPVGGLFPPANNTLSHFLYGYLQKKQMLSHGIWISNEFISGYSALTDLPSGQQKIFLTQKILFWCFKCVCQF